jgi:hypothetical protein
MNKYEYEQKAKNYMARRYAKIYAEERREVLGSEADE